MSVNAYCDALNAWKKVLSAVPALSFSVDSSDEGDDVDCWVGEGVGEVG